MGLDCFSLLMGGVEVLFMDQHGHDDALGPGMLERSGD